VPHFPSVPGIDDLYVAVGSTPPGSGELGRLLAIDARAKGRPAKLPFVALVIPAGIKRKVRASLAAGYLIDEARHFPDLAGFAVALNAGRVRPKPVQRQLEKEMPANE
ncbi:MAG: hypothetical protein HQ526_03705, partial [Actinobacteria bacterium]|nr:hypothetical protein [Actinomycetota bacterium]